MGGEKRMGGVAGSRPGEFCVVNPLSSERIFAVESAAPPVGERRLRNVVPKDFPANPSSPVVEVVQ